MPGLPFSANGHADCALGSDGDCAVSRLAVDEGAARRRDALCEKRLVRGTSSVVRHLFTDDKQERDRKTRVSQSFGRTDHSGRNPLRIAGPAPSNEFAIDARRDVWGHRIQMRRQRDERLIDDRGE